MVYCFPALRHLPTSQQSDHGIPLGWSACFGVRERPIASFSIDEMEDTHSRNDECVYRCPHKEFIFTETGAFELERCSVCVQCSRIEDHIRRTKLAQEWHEFLVPTRFDGMLHKSLRNSLQENRTQMYSAEVLRPLGSFVGRDGISFSLGCSECMMTFVREIMNLAVKTQRNARLQGIILIADDILRSYSRPIMKNVMRRAQLERQRRIDRLKTEKCFVDMKIDAGTVLRSHCTHEVIDSVANHEGLELILDVSRNKLMKSA